MLSKFVNKESDECYWKTGLVALGVYVFTRPAIFAFLTGSFWKLAQYGFHYLYQEFMKENGVTPDESLGQQLHEDLFGVSKLESWQTDMYETLEILWLNVIFAFSNLLFWLRELLVRPNLVGLGDCKLGMRITGWRCPWSFLGESFLAECIKRNVSPLFPVFVFILNLMTTRSGTAFLGSLVFMCGDSAITALPTLPAVVIRVAGLVAFYGNACNSDVDSLHVVSIIAACILLDAGRKCIVEKVFQLNAFFFLCFFCLPFVSFPLWVLFCVCVMLFLLYNLILGSPLGKVVAPKILGGSRVKWTPNEKRYR